MRQQLSVVCDLDMQRRAAQLGGRRLKRSPRACCEQCVRCGRAARVEAVAELLGGAASCARACELLSRCHEPRSLILLFFLRSFSGDSGHSLLNT